MLEGPVLWVMDARRRDTLCPEGLARLLDPARLLLARPSGALALLQVMEEALRSGAVPLVVGDLDEAPDLTQSRRLQLAAGTGGGRALCLVPEGRLRTNAAETRWRCTPVAAPTPGAGALQHWEIVKNKQGRLGMWEVSLGARASAPRPGEAAGIA
jgi:protein ImuA